MSSRKSITALTLMELVVVIAMIAILAAILLPVSANAWEDSKLTQCLNNMKQINQAIQMYLQEWDNFFPVVSMNAGTDTNPPAADPYYSPDPDLESGLLPYVENNYGLFRCPTDLVPTPADGSGNPLHLCSYGFGEAMEDGAAHGYCGVFGVYKSDGALRGRGKCKERNIRDLVAPANTVIFVECNNQATNDAYTVENCAFCPFPFFASSGHSAAPTYPHGTGDRYPFGDESGNFAFGDGHVKSIPQSGWTCTRLSPWTSHDCCIEIDGKYTFSRAGPGATTHSRPVP